MINSNTKNSLAPFTFLEKFKIISFKILKKIFRINTTTLIRKYNFILKLSKKNVPFSYLNKHINFKYLVNNTSFMFSLSKESSDIDVFEQIIFEEEYRPVLDILKENNIELNTVIDAGANIGLVTLFLKAHYPNTKIVSLEPSKSTYLRLSQNIKNNKLTNVSLLNEGVWGVSTKLAADFSFGDGRDWAFSLKENKVENKNTIPVKSIKDIIYTYNFETVDFLKIDIEGGEVNLFKESSDISWLQSIRIIAIEIHDELGVRDDIENILKEYNFKLNYSGELTIGVNKVLV